MIDLARKERTATERSPTPTWPQVVNISKRSASD